MENKREFVFQIISPLKFTGLILALGLFLFFLGIFPAKADSPYVTEYGEIFTGTLGVSDYARIIKVDDTYHMWYEDTTAKRLYHTTSADGEDWEAEELCDISDVHEPAVIWDENGSKFKMWYESLEAGHDGEIWYAESSEGVDWDEGSIQEVSFTGAGHGWEDSGRYMPFVIKDDTNYKMWYQSFSAAEPGDKRMNYATSDDGTTWNNGGDLGQIEFGGDANNNIVFGVSDPGNWDSDSLYSYSILDILAMFEVDDEYEELDFNLMLYGGHDGDGEFKLGGASSPNGIEWYRNIVNEYVISEEGESIYFPSMVLTINDNDLENAYLQIWFMSGTSVHYATLGNIIDIDIDIEDDDGHSGVQYDRYKHYKKEYKNEKNKKRYFTVRQIRRENPAFFWELRLIYLQYKSWSNEEMKKLSAEIQEKFKLFEGYHGYKKYRELKEKIN